MQITRGKNYPFRTTVLVDDDDGDDESLLVEKQDAREFIRGKKYPCKKIAGRRQLTWKCAGLVRCWAGLGRCWPRRGRETQDSSSQLNLHARNCPETPTHWIPAAHLRSCRLAVLPRQSLPRSTSSLRSSSTQTRHHLRQSQRNHPDAREHRRATRPLRETGSPIRTIGPSFRKNSISSGCPMIHHRRTRRKTLSCPRQNYLTTH